MAQKYASIVPEVDPSPSARSATPCRSLSVAARVLAHTRMTQIDPHHEFLRLRRHRGRLWPHLLPGSFDWVTPLCLCRSSLILGPPYALYSHAVGVPCPVTNRAVARAAHFDRVMLLMPIRAASFPSMTLGLPAPFFVFLAFGCYPRGRGLGCMARCHGKAFPGALACASFQSSRILEALPEELGSRS